MGLVKVVSNVPTEFGKQERGAFLATAPVPNRILDLDLVKHRAVVQLDEQRVSDRAFFRVVVVHAEALVLDTMDLGTECVDARVSGRLVRAAVVGIDRSNNVSFVRGEDKRENGLALGVEVSVNEWVRDHIVDCVANMRDKQGGAFE